MKHELIMPLLAAITMALMMVGCGKESSSDHPSGDHPNPEHPGDHPKP